MVWGQIQATEVARNSQAGDSSLEIYIGRAALNAYLDSSALVKVFVAEPGHEEVVDLVDHATLVASSRLSYVECRAAFSRAQREGRLTARSERSAIRSLDAQWPHLAVIELDEVLAHDAGGLTKEYALRAADAIHLASAKRLVGVDVSDLTFASWDQRLWMAASQARFVMVPRESP